MNTEMPEGTPVVVRKDNGTILKTVTRSKPWLLGGHTWVVMVDGIAGGYSLNRISPLSALSKPTGEEKL